MLVQYSLLAIAYTDTILDKYHTSSSYASQKKGILHIMCHNSSGHDIPLGAMAIAAECQVCCFALEDTSKG